MKKVRFLVLTVLTVLLLSPNITKAEDTQPSVSLTPNKVINEGDEVTLTVDYGSEVSSMYFDVEQLGFCTLFNCNDITKDDITIDGKAIGSEKRVDIRREGNRDLHIGITSMNDDVTKFKTVQVKVKATSKVTRTTIKVSNIKSVSGVPQLKGKSASVTIIDELTLIFKNNGNDVTLSIPRGSSLESLFVFQRSELDVIKNVIGNEKFAKFINVLNGEEFKVSDAIDEDITISAVYYISLTIDGKQYDKLLETTKIADLYKYVTAKDGYEFVGFIKSDGTAATDDDVKDGAEFISSYKKIDSSTSSNNGSNNISNPNTLDNVSLYFTIGIIGIIVIGLSLKYLLNTVKKVK